MPQFTTSFRTVHYFDHQSTKRVYHETLKIANEYKHPDNGCTGWQVEQCIDGIGWVLVDGFDTPEESED